MGEVTELHEDDRWKEPAHPSAQIVARESQAAVDRLIQQLDSLDTKASFLAAGGFVLIAGFIAGIAAKPPGNPHVQDAALAALVLDLVALVPIMYTWWPRTVDVPPHPRGLREHHFNDVESNVLMAIADRIGCWEANLAFGMLPDSRGQPVLSRGAEWVTWLPTCRRLTFNKRGAWTTLQWSSSRTARESGAASTSPTMTLHRRWSAPVVNSRGELALRRAGRLAKADV